MGKKIKLFKDCTDIGGCTSPGKQGTPASKYKVPMFDKKAKKKELKPVTAPEAGLHQNVRDLGNDAGDVKPQLNSGSGSYTEQQRVDAMAAEKAATKARTKLKSSKKKMY